MRPITNSEINTAIKFTKNKAPGLSEIKQIHLLHLPPNCIQILSQIYNSILATHYFPLILNHIKMIFLNKPGKSIMSPINYRPICLIEIILKIFEKIIAQRLSYFMEHNYLYTENQFGFRPYRGTQHSIALIKTTINENLNQNYASIVATRDVEKAFDTVWYAGLLYKINNLPIPGLDFLKLIYNFLTCRTIHPFFLGCEGDTFVPQAGVPQGSSTGPNLYTIFVNDHPKPIYKSSLYMQFADDGISISRSDTSSKTKRRGSQAKRKLLKEIKQTKNWENDWKIKSNSSKMSIALFGASNTKINKKSPVTIDGVHIPISKSVKILGYKLSINKHSTQHINTSINRARNQLHKLRRFSNAPSKMKSILYKTLIRPILEYPSVPLATTTKTNLVKIQRIQNQALRYIDGSKRSDKIKMSSLHEKYKYPAMNIRLYKLAKKCINKIINTYSPDLDKNPVAYYKYSDFQITDAPIKPRKRPILQKINKYISNNKKCLLYKLNKDNVWPEPEPIYV